MVRTLSDFFSILHKSNLRKEKPEEGVLLHIRARGIIASSLPKLLISVLLSFFLRVIFDFVGAIISLFRNFYNVIVAGAISFIHYVFVSGSAYDSIFVLVVLVLLLNAVSIASWVVILFFDVFDIISFCLLSKLWALIIILNPSSCKRGNISSLSAHIFSTRQLWRGVKELREGDIFFAKYVKVLGDDLAIKSLVDDYWKSEYI